MAAQQTPPSGKVRLGFVDTTHHHFRGVVRGALECPTAEIVGVYTADPVQRAELAGQYPSVTFYASAAELYDRGKPEAIVTCADNRAAAGVVAEAAARGVHVMKEKPMAATLKLADEMLTTANRLGVRLMINWSTNWSPAVHHAKRLVDEGAIGPVWQVHQRSGHGGPPPDYLKRTPSDRIGWVWIVDRERNGGGAYIDFCSYGAVLSRWIMGQPSRVVALGGRYCKDLFTVDDNAVLIMAYPRGHSIAEGTWTQPAVPVRIPTMIYGARGAIAVTGNSTLALARRLPGQAGPVEPESVDCPPLPEQYASAVAYFTHCLLHDEPFAGVVSPEVSRDSQEILEAGILSMQTGQEVGLPLKAFLA